MCGVLRTVLGSYISKRWWGGTWAPGDYSSTPLHRNPPIKQAPKRGNRRNESSTAALKLCRTWAVRGYGDVLSVRARSTCMRPLRSSSAQRLFSTIEGLFPTASPSIPTYVSNSVTGALQYGYTYGVTNYMSLDPPHSPRRQHNPPLSPATTITHPRPAGMQAFCRPVPSVLNGHPLPYSQTPRLSKISFLVSRRCQTPPE